MAGNLPLYGAQYAWPSVGGQETWRGDGCGTCYRVDGPGLNYKDFEKKKKKKNLSSDFLVLGCWFRNFNNTNRWLGDCGECRRVQ